MLAVWWLERGEVLEDTLLFVGERQVWSRAFVVTQPSQLSFEMDNSWSSPASCCCRVELVKISR